MKKYSDNPVRQSITSKLMDIVGNPDDTFDFANYIASLEATSTHLRRMFADSSIAFNSPLLQSSINQALVDDFNVKQPPLPFSGSYTVYKSDDAAIPETIKEQLNNLEPVSEVIVCHLTEAYITSYFTDDEVKMYYTQVCNEETTGTLDECIAFLQEKL